MKQKILIVDDEKDIVEFLKYNLENNGFEVITAFNGKVALDKINEMPDLIILDVMMPVLNGYEVCRFIRSNQKYSKIPIVFLTAKVDEVDELRGLELGADDFMQKPISPNKLIARVNSNLRKSKEENYEEIRIEAGPLIIDKEKFLVLFNNKEIFYPKKEFAILAHLAARPGKVFTREDILASVWGENVLVVDRTVDVHIRKIREKLGSNSEIIKTIKGVGYKLVL